MTKSQIKQYVQGITERKLVGQIDYDTLMNQVIQEFCAEHRFWWRKKNLTFNTAANTPTYDLSSIATVPANAGPFVEEISSIWYIDSSNNVNQLEAVTDDEGIAGVLADQSTGTPSGWLPEENDLQLWQTVRISPIPNGVFTLRPFFWAMPNPAQDTADDRVYIVPQPLHHALCTGLEKEIWRLAYGVQDPKYTTALALYNKKVATAQLKPSFWSGKTNYFYNQGEEAVRSTRGSFGSR